MSEQNVIKIVVDTNIWISFLLGKRLASIKDALLNSKATIYFSQELHNEVLKVLNYPRISKVIPENDFYELLTHFSGKIQFLSPDCAITECRDPKDNFLLELAIAAKADYLINGDSDLLDIKSFRGVKIVSASAFEKILSKLIRTK